LNISQKKKIYIKPFNSLFVAYTQDWRVYCMKVLNAL